MEISDKKIKEITRRISLSRMRILINNGFYGLLLMHMKISISKERQTAWTDCSERIWFNPDFVDTVSDQELDYILMHEILHAALRHSSREGDYGHLLYNIAADIVVNSNILRSNDFNPQAISLHKYGGEQMHLAPDGSEGYEHSVEEVYEMFYGKVKDKHLNCWDEHLHGNMSEEEEIHNKIKWDSYLRQACEAVSRRDPDKQRGLVPAMVERYLAELKEPQTDWRQLLTEFVQEEINDYSFMPPDRRMYESPFFLPDFNERDTKPGKILFAVDCSGSMSDEEIAACYAEIKGAIDQFGGKLEGWLGFFDCEFSEPVPFSDVDELLAIKPIGGGGTSFHVVFEYVDNLDEEELPASIVILTDGYAQFPDEEMSHGIPVLWVINNEEITPPWGKTARITI